MNAIFKLIAFMVLIMASGCVQKSYDRTVLFQLDAKAVKGIKAVGIRGNDKPLNWETDFPMKFDPKDSLYKTKVTWNTGYRCTELKFVVNGEPELKNKDNRKIYFNNKGMTTYKAVFDR